MLNQILFLVIGWLLGLLSPAIYDAVTKKRRQAEVKRGIQVELAELRFNLASAGFTVASGAGGWDREYLQWLKGLLDSYRGARDEDRRPLLETVARLNDLDDQQLAAAARTMGPPPAAAALRKQHLPYLDSHLEVVSSLRPETQRKLLEVQAQLGVINELVDDIRFCLGKAFDSLPPSTRQAIDASLQTSYRAVLQSSRTTADLIGGLNLG